MKLLVAVPSRPLILSLAAALVTIPLLFDQATAQSTIASTRVNQPRLQAIPLPAEMVDAVATRLNLRYHDEVGVSISADNRGRGGLLVMAPPDTMRRIVADANSLQKQLAASQSTSQARSVELHLIHVTWREIEDAFQTISGNRLSVTTSRNGERASFDASMIRTGGTSGAVHVEVDRRQNTIGLTGNSDTVNAYRALISSLDKAARFNGERTYLHKLEYADAAPVQRAIRLLRQLDASHPSVQKRIINRPQNTQASNRSNTKVNFQLAAFQGEGSDSQPASNDDAGGSKTPSAEVEAADESDDDGGGVIGDTDIQIIPESGLIIIKGAQKDIDRIKGVIAEIEEQAKVTQPEIEIRQLQHADSSAVASLLTQLYEDVLSARQGEVSITSLDSPNALLLIGRPEAIKAVEDLIQKIDQPIPETDRLRVFRLQHASATDAEATIRDFFSNRPGEDSEVRPGLGNRVRISSDYRTNSLIVGASPRDLVEVSRLVEQLDVQNLESSSQIRIFPLRNARAEDLEEVLQDSITGQPEDTGGDTTAPSSSLSIVALGGNGSTLDSGILSGTVITADSNANAIVVRAPAAGMPLIAELIRQLDQTPGIDSLVKVFTIKNGDAAQLTTALQDLFGDDASTTGTSIGAGNQAGLPNLSAADSALTPLRFSTDIRTNSIIVSGSAEDLEVVESILLRLDSTGFAERITEVIWLKHQIADNIAVAIQDYVSQRQQFQNIIPQFQQGLGPYDLPDRDIVVVPEAQTNSLLVSVSPRLYEEVRALIDRLDRRPPMVLIKTLIAEVRLADGFEIGGEFGLQDSVLFDRGVAVAPTTVDSTAATAATDIATGVVPSTPGFNFNGVGLPNNNAASRDTLGSQGLTAFGATASRITDLGSAGFVFSAASDSVNLFLRTLRVADRLQILSRPEIMTADNTTGFVQVGQNFPRPTEITQSQQGQTLIGIEDVDIGIILNVTPRVGSDGLILMDIDASRSAINTTVGQNIGFDNAGTPIFVPAIDITTAQATVTAFDGQTVVFGGLITKRRSNFTRKVPYLADIPLLGTFFKYEGEEEERTELLVVMTPQLVTGHEDLEYVKQVESSRMSWCLADVVEMHGDVGLSGGNGLWGPAIGPTIYPDIHPTVDVFPAADMPGGPHAMRHIQDAGLPYESPAQNVPYGETSQYDLAPGESIISHGELMEGSMSGVPASGSEMLPAPVQSPALPTELLPPPASELPAPITGTPVTGASARTPSTTAAKTPAKAASTSKPASKSWFNFNGKLGSFKRPSSK